MFNASKSINSSNDSNIREINELKSKIGQMVMENERLKKVRSIDIVQRLYNLEANNRIIKISSKLKQRYLN